MAFVIKSYYIQVLPVVTFLLCLCCQCGGSLTPQKKKECDDTSATIQHNDLEDVQWFSKCVVNYYGLQPLPSEKGKPFKKPQFSAYLKDKIPVSFEQTGMRIQRFFQRNNDWIKTKANPLYNKLGDSSNLLIVTDARYFYVTYLLFVLSGKTLKACSRDVNNKIIVPTYVCFLPPYGTTSATSDYDVGLIGRTSGTLTVKFNEYFKKEFKKPSEQVFDTNIYGFSLEYAIPEFFTGLSLFYTRVLPQLDFDPQFQMLELAGAYMKMYRFNQEYFASLEKNAEEQLGGLGVIKDVRNRNIHFKRWMERFIKMDKKKSLKGGEDLRAAHNEEYNAIIKDVEKLFDSQYTSDITKYVLEMSKALMYAAEAYHTRGAIRHVVGVLQLNLSKSTLTVMDYWESMIENWADANKALNHCVGSAETCLLTMCKYLFRTFNAMKGIHFTLVNPVGVRNALIEPIKKFLPKYSVFGGDSDLEVLTRQWVAKYKGKANELPYDAAKLFLTKVGCTEQEQPPATSLSKACLDRMEKLVEAYDHLLIATTRKATTEKVILLTPSGQVKPTPV